MKPFHWVLVVAAIGVGALVIGLRSGEPGPSRRTLPRKTIIPEPSRGVAGIPSSEARGFRVRLSIRLPDEKPAGCAEISLRGRENRELIAPSNGTLEIQGLEAGAYNLIAHLGRWSGALDFALEADRELGILKLRDSVTLRGRVLGPMGKPVAAAEIEAVAGDPKRGGFDLMAMVRSITRPESVLSRARARPDGAYELLAQAGVPLRLRAFGSRLAQDARAVQTFMADTAGIGFHLMPGAMLVGRVIDEQGRPLPGTRIMLVNMQSLLEAGLPKSGVTADAEGRFELAYIPGSANVLLAYAPGYALYAENNREEVAGERTIQLDHGIGIRLRATDASRPGQPAAGVHAMATYHGGFATGETDKDGALLLLHLPRARSPGLGDTGQILLWGGGFVARKVLIGKVEGRKGLLDLGTVALDRGGVVTGSVLDTVTDKPIPGARVRSLGGLEDELAVVGAATTHAGADGRYELRGVPLLATGLLATHPGYVLDTEKMMEALQQGAAGGTAPHLFREGERTTTRDLRLEPAAAAAGIVLGPDEKPVPGARIAPADSFGATLLELLGGPPSQTVTDREGRFRLRGMKKGATVTVQASHPQFSVSSPASITAGDPAPAILHLGRPVRVRGRVLDAKGRPIRGVRVSATKEERPVSLSIEPAFSTAPVAVTADKGEFLLLNAPRGPVVISFEQPHYAPARRRVELGVQVEPYDLGTIELSRGGVISGLVAGVSGEPLAGIALQATSLGESRSGVPGRDWGQATTGEDGRFAFYGLRPGRYRIWSWNSSYFLQERNVATGARELRFVARRASLLLGRVVSHGLPVQGARVSAYIPGRAPKDPEGPGDASKLGEDRTNARGEFRLQGLPPDRPFRVEISHSLFRDRSIKDVHAGQERRRFELEPGGRVAGTVVDTKGQPVAGVLIVAHVGGDDVGDATSRADGSFVIGGLEAGRLTLRTEGARLDLVKQDPVPVTLGETSIRLVVIRGLAITGRIVGATQDPESWWVAALDAQGEPEGETTMERTKGLFFVHGLRPGTYSLRLLKYGQDMEEIEITRVEGIEAGAQNVAIRVPR